MKRKTKSEPLLYITQPFSNVPNNKMQEVFMSRQDVKEDSLDASIEESSKKKNHFKVSLAKSDLPIEAETTADIREEELTPNKLERKRTFNKVKSFKEMNTGERLEYLRNFPKALPPVPCVFSNRG